MLDAKAKLDEEKEKWEDKLKEEIEREKQKNEEEQSEKTFNKQLNLLTSSAMFSVLKSLQQPQTQNCSQAIMSSLPSTSRETMVREEDKLKIVETTELNVLSNSPPVVLLVDKNALAADVIKMMKRHFGIIEDIVGMILDKGTERQIIESMSEIKAASVSFKVYERRSSGLVYFLLSNLY